MNLIRNKISLSGPELMKDISASIEHYGYAVVVLHAMDFVKVYDKGQFTNTVDESEIKDLSYLVDYVLSRRTSST
jgi:hypothetical protein